MKNSKQIIIDAEVGISKFKHMAKYAITILLSLAKRANADGSISIRIDMKKEIALETGFHFSTVNQGVKNLRDNGFILPLSYGEYTMNSEFVSVLDKGGSNE